MPQVLTAEQIKRYAALGRVSTDEKPPKPAPPPQINLAALEQSIAGIAKAVEASNGAASEAVVAALQRNAELLEALLVEFSKPDEWDCEVTERGDLNRISKVKFKRA